MSQFSPPFVVWYSSGSGRQDSQVQVPLSGYCGRCKWLCLNVHITYIHVRILCRLAYGILCLVGGTLTKYGSKSRGALGTSLP